MRKILLSVLCCVYVMTTFTACVEEDEMADNPAGNFEALWKIMDEHYCFFDYKAQVLGVDWNEIHTRYARQIDASMTDDQLFQVLGNMLSELKDGHVNLYSSWDMAHNWSWHEDYPSNISDTLINKYLGTDYRTTVGLQYRFLDDNIGYIRCSSFSVSFGEGNLDNILSYLSTSNALIIDLRDNGGGYLTSAEQLAARFTNKETLVGYMQHKTGKAHNAFSGMKEQRIKPSNGLRWQKKVAILTNRAVFSAANEFVKYMKCFPEVITIGDQTGGGAGMPYSNGLPNGWSVRFSACPMYDSNKESTEFGISPDYKVDMRQDDLLKGKDTIIETARALLRQ